MKKYFEFVWQLRFILGACMGCYAGYSFGVHAAPSADGGVCKVPSWRTKPDALDPAKLCHVVEHNSSDGFYYWSCEENKETNRWSDPR